MKKILKVACAILALVLIMSFLVSCTKAPGLYNWLGIRMNVDKILKLTLDVGDGEKEYLVPFDMYRDIFVFFKAGISEYVPLNEDGNSAKLATAEEQTKALKEFTNSQIVDYYCLLALCDKYGVGIGDDNGELYKQEYDKQVKEYADQITDEDMKDFDGTKLEYAEKLYEENIKKIGMTPEYFEHSFYKSLLEKRLKMAIVPDLYSYINQSYSRFEEIYIEYTIGDSVSEREAFENAYAAYEELKNGTDVGTLIKKYNNNVLYSSDIIVDLNGNILGSETNSTVSGIILEMLSSLNPNEYSEVLSGEAEDGETGYYAIIYKMDFDNDLLYGSSTISKSLFQYNSVGANTYTSYYTLYSDLIESYSQNMRVEIYDEKAYNRIGVKTLF